MLFSMENWEFRVAIIFSRDLPKVLNSDIYLYDSEHFGGLLGFGIMTMVVTFHCSGKKPVLIQAFLILFKNLR